MHPALSGVDSYCGCRTAVIDNFGRNTTGAEVYPRIKSLYYPVTLIFGRSARLSDKVRNSAGESRKIVPKTRKKSAVNSLLDGDS